jgi:hypothetical protein
MEIRTRRMRRAVVLAALVGTALVGCGGEAQPAASSATTASASTTSGPSTTAAGHAVPMWPEVPEWAQPMIDYLDAYRVALASADLEEIYPFLAQGVRWWNGPEESRVRTGWRDTLLGLRETAPVHPQPGIFFVLAYPVQDGLGYVIDWIQVSIASDGGCDGEACRPLQVLRLVVDPRGITAHSVRPLAADVIDQQADPAEVQLVRARYEEIAERLSSANPDYAAEMMSDRPVWRSDGEGGLQRIDPREAWAVEAAPIFAALPETRVETVSTTDLGYPGTTRPLVFFTPGPAEPWYGEGTVGGIGIYRLTPEPGSPGHVVAIDWLEQPQGIIEFEMMFQPPDFGAVLDLAANPWIAEPSLWPQVPPPTGQVTGTIDIGGVEVEVRNGSPSQQALVEWALGRYEAAGLPAPIPRSIAFPPSVNCVLHAGLAIDTGEGVDLQLCFDEAETCTGDDCVPSTSAQSTLLHELGHVWTVQNTDETTRAAFLETRGLEAWSGPGVSRDEQGTEHAAEILSWALMEADSWPARLPDSECAELAAAYEVLTGRPPPRSCAA